MSYPFESIIIIYNPNSTGDSHDQADMLRRRLKGELPSGTTVKLQATKHAGHAEEIATRHAKRDGKTLLISSSGDGGYNELINGALAYKTRHLTVAVLPSGNANDHSHATADDSLADRIIAGKTRLIDVLDVRTTQSGRPWQRYAHSYIGIGLTAYIGKRLAEAELNPINEKWLVLKYLLKFGHVALRFEGHRSWRRYSNVVAANIDRMSKIIRLADDAQIDDGQFELYMMPSQSLIATLRVMLLGAVFGLTPTGKTSKVQFVAKRAAELQCDGEVYRFDSGHSVTIRARRRRLRTLA